MTTATDQLILGPETTLQEAVTAVTQGRSEQIVLVEWALSTPIDLTQVGLLIGLVDGATFAEIMQAQQRMIAAAARKSVESTGGLRCKVSKKGCISVYGINSKMPVTLYVGQWERLLTWVGAKDGNPIAAFAAGNPTGEYAVSDYKSKEDVAFLASNPPHAKRVGDRVTVSLARRA